jgi:hypothetical protein
MMANERFLIQRYAGGNWPQVRGEIPFVSTGPNFYGWAIKGSLTKYSEHKFVSSLKIDIEDGFGRLEEQLARECVAELLLSEGIIQALWAAHSEVTKADRWQIALSEIASQIPTGPLGEGVVELLSGLSAPEHFKSYVAEDAIDLEHMEVPIGC